MFFTRQLHTEIVGSEITKNRKGCELGDSRLTSGPKGFLIKNNVRLTRVSRNLVKSRKLS